MATSRRAGEVLYRLRAAGVDDADAVDTLEREGVDKFAASFRSLPGCIAGQRGLLGMTARR